MRSIPIFEKLSENFSFFWKMYNITYFVTSYSTKESVMMKMDFHFLSQYSNMGLESLKFRASNIVGNPQLISFVPLSIMDERETDSNQL